MARGVVIDLTALDTDDEDTPDKNVALVQQSSAGWAGASPASKRRRTSSQVRRRPPCCAGGVKMLAPTAAPRAYGRASRLCYPVYTPRSKHTLVDTYLSLSSG